MNVTRHRIQFDCPEELYLKLNALVPHGVKRFVMEVITQALVDRLLEGDRTEILTEVMRRRFKFDDSLTLEMLDGLARTEGERKRP